jgi:hypothetical protein
MFRGEEAARTRRETERERRERVCVCMSGRRITGADASNLKMNVGKLRGWRAETYVEGATWRRSYRYEERRRGKRRIGDGMESFKYMCGC